MRWTKNDLAKAGLVFDPLADKLVPINGSDARPDDTWELDALVAHYNQLDQEADDCLRRSLDLQHHEALRRYRMGRVIDIAGGKVKRGQWGAWCKEVGIHRQSAWRYHSLFKAANAAWKDRAEAEVLKRTVSELYEKFGITKKPEKSRPQENPAEATEKWEEAIQLVGGDILPMPTATSPAVTPPPAETSQPTVEDESVMFTLELGTTSEHLPKIEKALREASLTGRSTDVGIVVQVGEDEIANAFWEIGTAVANGHFPLNVTVTA